jgi:hypothetical protein
MPARYDGNRPIDAFGAYDGHPDAEESLYFEREIR